MSSADQAVPTKLPEGTFSERLVVWGNGRPIFLLVVGLGLQVAICLAQSRGKLFWTDELITWYVARQPGILGVWDALRAGADPNPPLMHLLVKLSCKLFGMSGLRVPAYLGMTLATGAIWYILRRWVRPVFALIGVLAFLTTRGSDYGYDARSYAPMMGFTLAAVAMWMRSTEVGLRRPQVALWGMAVALAAAVSSNYYCVLAVLPIAAGELVFGRSRGGARPRVWAALAAGAAPLLLYLPLIWHNLHEFAPFAWNRPHPSMIILSYVQLVEGIVWPVLLLALYAQWRCRAGRFVPDHEAIAIAVLLVYPLLGYTLAQLGSAMISPRCVAPVCCGFGVAAGVLTARVFGGSPRRTLAVLGLLLVWVGVRQVVCARLLREQRSSFLALRDTLATDIREGRGTVLMADSSLAVPLYFYSTPEVRERLVYPIDFKAIHRFEKDDSGEENLWAGRGGVFPFPVITLGAALRGGRPRLALARPDGWLAQDLRARGICPEPMRKGQIAPLLSGTGGVSTPMAHPETRELRLAPCPAG